MKGRRIILSILFVSLSLFVMGCSGPQQQNPDVVLTLDSNGGEGTSQDMHGIEGVKVNIIPNKYTKKGYNFKGWAKDKNSTTIDYADEAEYIFTVDETLYAIWEKIPLTAPANLKLEEKSGKFYLTWDKVEAAEKYVIYKALENDSSKAKEYDSLDVSTFKYLTTITDNETSYTYSVSLTDGDGLYYFWMKSESGSDVSDLSEVVSFNKGNLQPVKNLEVSKANYKNHVKLTWENNNNYDFPQYELYVATENDFNKATLRTKSLSKNQEINLKETGKYYFWLKTVDLYGHKAKSAESDAASIDFTYEELENPEVTGITLSGTTVTVNWTKNDAYKYAVYYVYDNGLTSNKKFDEATLVKCVSGDTSSVTIPNVGKGYIYVWVLACDNDPSIFDDAKTSTPNVIPEIKSL